MIKSVEGRNIGKIKAIIIRFANYLINRGHAEWIGVYFWLRYVSKS